MSRQTNFILLSLSKMLSVKNTLDEVCQSVGAVHLNTTDSMGVLESLLDNDIDLLLFHTEVSEESMLKTVEIISRDNQYRNIPIIIISDHHQNEVLAEKLSVYPVISIFAYENWHLQITSLLRLLINMKDDTKSLRENLTMTKESNSIDPLTGALNRRGGEKKFESSVGYYTSNNEPFSLIIFDIDFFKKVNDTYGHNIGDEVLVEVASIIKEAIRKDDALIRFGGEEFMVILSNCNIDAAKEKAELFRKMLEAARYSVKKFGITASFGVVEYKMGLTLESLVEKADALLYKAKAGGRNQVCCELSLQCIP